MCSGFGRRGGRVGAGRRILGRSSWGRGRLFVLCRLWGRGWCVCGGVRLVGGWWGGRGRGRGSGRCWLWG